MTSLKVERGAADRTITGAVGDAPKSVDAATQELVEAALCERELMREMDDLLALLEQRCPAAHDLPGSQEDAIPLLCAAPIATSRLTN